MWSLMESGTNQVEQNEGNVTRAQFDVLDVLELVKLVLLVSAVSPSPHPDYSVDLDLR